MLNKYQKEHTQSLIYEQIDSVSNSIGSKEYVKGYKEGLYNFWEIIENTETIPNRCKLLEAHYEILDVATEKFGKDQQIIMCIEELGELTQCLCKYLRGKLDLIHLQEEVGDVIIKGLHMAHLFGEKEIQSSINYKLSRTNEILNTK
jgi:NTP pyrophosphatase (non-canonical NTP hydrolase)